MRLRTPILLSASLLLVISSVSCSTVPIVPGCSQLAETVLTTPTGHAVLADSGDPLTDWRNYGLAETGNVTKADDKAITGFRIIRNCEVRDHEIRRSLRPWYQRLFG